MHFLWQVVPVIEEGESLLNKLFLCKRNQWGSREASQKRALMLGQKVMEEVLLVGCMSVLVFTGAVNCTCIHRYIETW